MCQPEATYHTEGQLLGWQLSIAPAWVNFFRAWCGDAKTSFSRISTILSIALLLYCKYSKTYVPKGIRGLRRFSLK